MPAGVSETDRATARRLNGPMKEEESPGAIQYTGRTQAMGSEPLIQKLFALERAVGQVDNIRLRAMIIEAEEAALAMDREILDRLRTEPSGLPAMTNASLARDLATRAGPMAPGTRQESGDEGFSIGFSRGHRRSA